MDLRTHCVAIIFVLLMLLIPGDGRAWAGDGGETVPAFTLEMRLTGQSGPIVNRPLVFGDMVYAQVWLPLMGSAGKPVLANIIWQLYDAGGAPIVGVGAIRQMLEMGGDELVTFKVPIKGLVNGNYYLALTHQQAARPDISFQTSQRFTVNQEVAVTRVVVDESLEGKKNHALLYEDQSAYIFVYYTLADTVSSVRIVLDILDRQADKLVATRTVVQKNDYMEEEQRLGVHFPPGFFHPGDELIVRALLTTAGGSAQVQSAFAVQGITLVLHLPTTLRQAEEGRYRVEVPPSFEAPFIVDMRGGDALRFTGDNSLTGTVQALGDSGEQEVDVLVVDKNGRRATASSSLEILPGTNHHNSGSISPGQKVLPRYSVPAQGGAVGSSSPQRY